MSQFRGVGPDYNRFVFNIQVSWFYESVTGGIQKMKSFPSKFTSMVLSSSPLLKKKSTFQVSFLQRPFGWNSYSSI